MSGEFLLYQAPDGTARIHLRVSDGTVWLTQRQLAELYQVSVPTINGHLRTLYQDGELPADRTIRKFRIVAREAARDVERQVDHYTLEVTLAEVSADILAVEKEAEGLLDGLPIGGTQL